jgi:hypothetical protein
MFQPLFKGIRNIISLDVLSLWVWERAAFEKKGNDDILNSLNNRVMKNKHGGPIYLDIEENEFD